MRMLSHGRHALICFQNVCSVIKNCSYDGRSSQSWWPRFNTAHRTSFLRQNAYKFFVSLTLWVFHPAMRMMLLLAVMDTPREHSDDIEIFFDTFNKALGDYLNESDYIWDPFLIMMDHKGTNFEALEHVYGENFRKYKAVTCQWHFLHCTEKYLMKCLELERKSFCTWCMQLCQAHT